MKRRSFTSLLAVLLLLSCLAVPVFAAQTETGYVTDEAGILSASECASLEHLASSVSEQYDFGVYIVILRDYRDYRSSGVEACAVQWYDGNALGRGADNAGCLLLLSMEGRDFVVDYYSSRADSIFTERDRDKVEDQFIPYLRSDDYARGLEVFLNACAQCLDAAGNGGAGAATENIGNALVIALIPGAIAALLAGIITMSPMRSARQKRDADQYTVHGGLHLRRRSDMFLRRTVTRRPRNTESSGGGGGNHSHSYSSGGHSGRSGKF